MRHDVRDLVTVALGRAPVPGERLAIAVSGGPDSVALLLHAARAFPGQVVALTVDHGLRPASLAEAAAVAERCKSLRIEHVMLNWSGPKPRANLQAAARKARYALMAEWCAGNGVGLLLTAHHADDQAETMLLRLARGSGSGGLAGIRRRRDLGPGVTLLRPMLTKCRKELHEILAESDWPVVDDPSNCDPRFDRSHARTLLATTPWLDASRIALAADHLAETEVALEWAAERAWAGRASVGDTDVRLDTAGLPAELVRRIVLKAIAALAADAIPRGSDIGRLIARLEQGGTATLAGVRARGGQPWRFTRAPPRRK